MLNIQKERSSSEGSFSRKYICLYFLNDLFGFLHKQMKIILSHLGIWVLAETELGKMKLDSVIPIYC